MDKFEKLTLKEKLETFAEDIYSAIKATPDDSDSSIDFCFRMAQYLFRCGWRTKTDEPLKQKFSTEDDTVNHPSHYTDGKIEVIDFIEDKGLNFHRGNAVKYISRAGKKNPAKEVEDLKKAVWYLNREIQRMERDNDSKKD